MTADLVSFVRDGVKRPEYRGKGCILGKCPSWMERMGKSSSIWNE